MISDGGIIKLKAIPLTADTTVNVIGDDKRETDSDVKESDKKLAPERRVYQEKQSLEAQLAMWTQLKEASIKIANEYDKFISELNQKTDKKIEEEFYTIELSVAGVKVEDFTVQRVQAKQPDTFGMKIAATKRKQGIPENATKPHETPSGGYGAIEELFNIPNDFFNLGSRQRYSKDGLHIWRWKKLSDTDLT